MAGGTLFHFSVNLSGERKIKSDYSSELGLLNWNDGIRNLVQRHGKSLDVLIMSD